MAPRRLELIALDGIPLVRPGDDLAGLIRAALAGEGLTLRDGDVLVLAQKIVSKAEGRYVALAGVTPSAEAIGLAKDTDKDPRLIETILSESTRVVRHRPGVVIVEHRLGLVLANAGVDASNVEPDADGGEQVLLLPLDPNETCRRLRADFLAREGVQLGVLVNDSLGRPWRHGTMGIAIGAAGLESLEDLRGALDMFGRPLRVSLVGAADQLAAAASIVQGEADEGTPVALIRGLDKAGDSDQDAQALVRPAAEDLFR